MVSVTLNSGYKMPLIGFGVWKIANDACADTVYSAIQAGYRLIDGAAIYGNEMEVGQGIARAIKEGLVKREDLFIVSKLWLTFHDPEHVTPIIKKQLADLQVDYLDLYYIHFPYAMKYVDPAIRYPSDWTDEFNPGNATLESTWHAMESLVTQGLTKSIGISNYNGVIFMDLLNYAKIKPAVLQIEHHPYLTQEALVNFVQSSGVQITAYSSFGPSSFIELDLPRAKDIAPLFEQGVIKTIAKKHSKTPAQVLLRWAIQRGISVIPKSISKERLTENLDIFNFDLDEAEIKQIGALNQGLRFNDPLDDNVPIPVFA